MHQENINLETMIEDEFLYQNLESERILHDNYGIEFDECYQINPELFEPNQAIERFHEISDESNFNELAIIELKPEWEIREVTIEKPFILKYLNPK